MSWLSGEGAETWPGQWPLCLCSGGGQLPPTGPRARPGRGPAPMRTWLPSVDGWQSSLSGSQLRALEVAVRVVDPRMGPPCATSQLAPTPAQASVPLQAPSWKWAGESRGAGGASASGVTKQGPRPGPGQLYSWPPSHDFAARYHGFKDGRVKCTCDVFGIRILKREKDCEFPNLLPPASPGTG